MNSSDPNRALTDVKQMLERDLTRVPDDELIVTAKQLQAIENAVPRWSGRVLAALHLAGWSWTDIKRVTGVPPSTARRRAQLYLPGPRRR